MHTRTFTVSTGPFGTISNIILMKSKESQEAHVKTNKNYMWRLISAQMRRTWIIF